MARIQILELPMKHVGEFSETPFAIVIDQVETEALMVVAGIEVNTLELTQMDADTIARSVGAVGAILTACTLDVA